MKAQNRMYASALPYGLAMARVVGRQEAELRSALGENSVAFGAIRGDEKQYRNDMLKLEKVGLVGIFRDRRSLVAWSLTANGRALFNG